jgi:DNA-binding IclR family transcriptional regulator
LAPKRPPVSKRPQRTERPAAADGSSRKVLRALLAFSIDKPKHSAESLSEAIGVPLSSTYRYIGILREAHLIDEESRGSFILAPRVIGLAQAARAGTDLATIARPFMKRMAHDVGETVILLRRSGDRAVCIERVESSSRIRLTFEVGMALPLHRGAACKVLLANLPASESEAILDDIAARDAAFGPQRRGLMRELATIREQGWSESRGEITPHVYAVAVGVTDPNGIVAAISFVAPAFRTPKAGQIRLREQISRAAADISKAYSAVSF